MKTLILSCNTGEGHNSCAKAIKEYYDKHNEECEIVDALMFISPRASNFMSWGLTFTYRHIPGLFRHGYSYAEKHPELFRKDSAIYNYLTSASWKLAKYIIHESYNNIICTHVFSALILSEVNNFIKITANTSFVATDYTCSPSMKESSLAYYFIPDESLIDDFVCENIPRSNIYASGVPVRECFRECVDKDKAKKEFGIDSHSKHIVLMCGSMGCGPISRIVKGLSRQLSENEGLSIVCGSNQKLERKLSHKYHDSKNISVLGYIDNISLLLDSADLYITKPGGISVTEAASKKIPMVFIDAVSGCEDYNCNFFVNKNVAIRTKTVKEIVTTSMDLIKNEALIEELKMGYDNDHESGAAMIYHILKNERFK